MKNIKERYNKLTGIPTSKWTKNDFEFMKIVSDPKMREKLNKI